ncbi:ABC transporter ATP-binding protein [Hydrogenoanaerobacterium sp.]|uniref:ABC transporter ATP-binding protein n=1 Tax=Hydrogenoanaerobacterium sp. TaxID=2953763 RepID=UPI0028A03293|nr:ABC transporter ATP-binding protein [Hydrogenoanaerobacterium sp.]
MPTAIEMRNVTKTFHKVVANDNCNLSIEQGEIHSILGENGAGKSTLMNVLFGMYRPDSGTVLINGKEQVIRNTGDAFRLGLGMVHQHFMLVENMTVLQNIILGQEKGRFKIDYKTSHAEVEEIVRQYGLELDLNARVDEISVGLKQRVEIVKTLYRGADIIVLDEPTAVLTPQESDKLMVILKNMRKMGKTIIFITHKLKETMEVADRATILRDGRTISTVEIAKTNVNELAAHMVGREVNFDIGKAPCQPGKTMLDIRDLKLLNSTDKTVSFQVRSGEIIGVAGVDGNGQLELEESIMGLRPIKRGSIRFQERELIGQKTLNIKELGIGHIPSDRYQRAILPKMSLSENYLLGFQDKPEFKKKGFVNYKKLKAVTARMLEQFNVKCSGIEQKIGQLSGGNQQKVVLGREVEDCYKLVLAAQPGRGLDIGAVQFIHNQFLRLRSEGKAVLLISADLEEIQKLSDRIAVLYKGELMEFKPAEEYTTEEIGLLMAGKRMEENNAKNNE